MLQLLDKLDIEYKRLETLGHWEKKKDPEILALTATISCLQTEFSNVKTKYAMLAKTPPSTANLSTTNNNQTTTKLQKPPPRQVGTPEIVVFQGFTWKWCDKCFNGSWNRTHVTSEHMVGVGKRNRCHTPPSDQTPVANIATTSTPTETDVSTQNHPSNNNNPQTTTTALQSSVASSILDFFYD
jgi:hypothetical protein